MERYQRWLYLHGEAVTTAILLIVVVLAMVLIVYMA